MEQEEFYQAPKTAKMFVSTIQNAFTKRDGERVAKEFRDFYMTPLYSNVPEKTWNVSINHQVFQNADSDLGTQYAKMFELIRDFAM